MNNWVELTENEVENLRNNYNFWMISCGKPVFDYQSFALAVSDELRKKNEAANEQS